MMEFPLGSHDRYLAEPFSNLDPEPADPIAIDAPICLPGCSSFHGLPCECELSAGGEG